MAKQFRTKQTLVDTGFKQLSGNTLSLSGNTLISGCGSLAYSTCRHNIYTSRSVVDVEYVTGCTSAILNIGSNQQVIYRDINGITGATGFLFDKALSGVTVPNLLISATPVTDVSALYLLSWDSGTSQVRKVNYSTAAGLTSAINGLSVISDCACLGGLLTNDTTICGNDNSLDFRDMCGLCIITTGNNIVLDSRCNTGGIYLKSQCSSGTTPNNFSNSVGIAIDYQSNLFKIYDNRAGASQVGIEYAGDYSTFYTSRSVVDKEYVDAIASGLYPLAAVDVATFSAITMSGLTTVDGITLVSGERILVKNQADAKTNGIYSASTGTWGRTSDYNQSSEVIHGTYTYVLSGNTNTNTSWVLSTPDPITLGVTNLIFTSFNQVTDIIAGQGITVSKYFGQNTISLGGILTGSTIIIDNRITKKGIEYGGNYCTGFTNCSLIDKEYVDRAITGNSNIINVYNPTISTYTATTSNDFIGVSGGSTIWLPTISVCTGQRITVADIAGNAATNSISICSGSYKILNCYSATINTNYGSVSFIFNGKNFWSAMAFIN
jgi:hypothetical protein